ncbi:MAG: hypothetical protein WC294_00700 [Methanoregula sp.]|jgi:hypothetical protein
MQASKHLIHNDIVKPITLTLPKLSEELPITGIRGLPHPLLLGNKSINVPYDKPTGRSPANGVSLAPSVPVGCKDPACQPETGIPAAANLDIPTPESGERVSSTVIGGASPTPESGEKKRLLTLSSRRFYGRSLMGLKLPGKYYFITLTSTPKSPPIKKSWDPLRKWLKYQRPGICWCYCITREGYGVIHMIIRLKSGDKRISAKELREYWKNLTGADQIWIDYVDESQKYDLAVYISDQRKKRKLGGELAWQYGIVRWRWSKGWLPRGFTKAFGRVWHRLQDIPIVEREKAVSGWLAACHMDGNNIYYGPGMSRKTGEIRWPTRNYRYDIVDPAAVQFDKELMEILSRDFTSTVDETVQHNRFVSRLSSYGET